MNKKQRLAELAQFGITGDAAEKMVAQEIAESTEANRRIANMQAQIREQDERERRERKECEEKAAAERREATEKAEAECQAKLAQPARIGSKGRVLLTGEMAVLSTLAVGKAIQAKRGWLHVQQVVEQPNKPGRDWQWIDHIAIGVYVTPEKAEKLNTAWEKAAKIARMEKEIERYRNGDMLQGTEYLAEMEAQLAAAKAE